MTGGLHHPWRRFRRFVDWTLERAHLPGDLMGFTDHARKVVTLDADLNQQERRCTIDHECDHIERGLVPDFYWPREEAWIDEAVARRLVPLEALGRAMLWAYHEEELADVLWVDVPTLQARFRTLTAAETDELNRLLDEHEKAFPSECC